MITKAAHRRKKRCNAPEAEGEGWWAVLGSNQRPRRCQRRALTN